MNEFFEQASSADPEAATVGLEVLPGVVDLLTALQVRRLHGRKERIQLEDFLISKVYRLLWLFPEKVHFTDYQQQAGVEVFVKQIPLNLHQPPRPLAKQRACWRNCFWRYVPCALLPSLEDAASCGNTHHNRQTTRRRHPTPRVVRCPRCSSCKQCCELRAGPRVQALESCRAAWPVVSAGHLPAHVRQ